MDYFTGRGLTVQTIKHFGLGYAPDDWHALERHLLKKGYSEYLMKAADLIAVSDKTGQNGKPYTYDRFRNRVMFPLINIHGKVIGFGGRAMPGDEKKGGKYINTSDTPVFKKSQNMYAMNFAKSFCSKQAILVEGNMDVIALHQAGFKNAVAALGTSFTEEQAKLLGRYTKEVVVTLDADDAGEKATERAMKILSSVGVEARILRLPECKDPDEFIKKNGPARFDALINGAVSDIEYRLYMAAKGIDLDADDGRLQYLRKACEVLAELQDPIAIDLYAGKLSKYGVNKDIIKSETEKMINSRKRRNNRRQLDDIVTPRIKPDGVNPQKQQFRRAAAAEETLISVLIKHPDLLDRARSGLKPSDMLTDFNRKLYIKVEEILSAGREFDSVLLGNEFTPDEISYVTRMLKLGAGNANAVKELDDSIKVILEEKSVKDRSEIINLPDEEWADAMKKLSRGHK